MEIYEKISYLMKQKKMSKKEFATRLVSLEPKSNRTGEIISEKIVYFYLNGHTAIKAYLIPYISDVLGVPEQFLFDESDKSRIKIIRYIGNTLTQSEKSYLQSLINKDNNIEAQNEIIDLIKYAPQPMLSKIKRSLLEIKNITNNL